MNLNTNKVSPAGGLLENHASAMKMKANLLPEMLLVDAAEKVVASAKKPVATN